MAHQHKSLETLLRSVFERHGAGSVSVATLAEVLGGAYSTNVIGMACASLVGQGFLARERTAFGVFYSMTNAEGVRTRHETLTAEWRPLQPIRQTVIPVRGGGGRVAPDVSDGPYVGLSSRALYFERIDA